MPCAAQLRREQLLQCARPSAAAGWEPLRRRRCGTSPGSATPTAARSVVPVRGQHHLLADRLDQGVGGQLDQRIVVVMDLRETAHSRPTSLWSTTSPADNSLR